MCLSESQRDLPGTLMGGSKNKKQTASTDDYSKRKIASRSNFVNQTSVCFSYLTLSHARKELEPSTEPTSLLVHKVCTSGYPPKERHFAQRGRM